MPSVMRGDGVSRTRDRLGSWSSVPSWIDADVAADWSAPPMDVWHEGDGLHFLAGADDRVRYRAHLEPTLKPDGTAIIADGLCAPSASHADGNDTVVSVLTVPSHSLSQRARRPTRGRLADATVTIASRGGNTAGR